jgi:hypothetical protein
MPRVQAAFLLQTPSDSMLAKRARTVLPCVTVCFSQKRCGLGWYV